MACTPCTGRARVACGRITVAPQVSCYAAPTANLLPLAPLLHLRGEGGRLLAVWQRVDYVPPGVSVVERGGAALCGAGLGTAGSRGEYAVAGDSVDGRGVMLAPARNPLA